MSTHVVCCGTCANWHRLLDGGEFGSCGCGVKMDSVIYGALDACDNWRNNEPGEA